MSAKKNIVWIDNVKAISMISVYILHSEQFLSYEGISYGYWLKPFYINAFFFVSGYLFFMKFNPNKVYLNNVVIKHIKKIMAVIFWPTLVFSSIIYLPKIFFHNKELSIHKYFYEVFGGISFWFTSSLFIAQLVLCILLIFKIKNILHYLVISSLFFFTVVVFKNYDLTPFPWYYKSGLGATLFLVLGGIFLVFQKKNIKIKKSLKFLSFVSLFILYVVLMTNDMVHLTAKKEIISMSFNFYGFTETLLGIIIIVIISNQIKKVEVLKFISKNSILFYFFSGALPASIGKGINIFLEQNNGYWAVLLNVTLSLFTCSLLVILINKYFAFLLDFQKLNFLKRE